MLIDLIVTRHPGAVEWLRRKGITAPVVAQATPPQIRNKVVVGNLPIDMAAMTMCVVAICYPGEAAPRGAEYTADDMDRANAELRTFSVRHGYRSIIAQSCGYPAAGERIGDFVATNVMPPSDCIGGEIIWEYKPKDNQQ